MQTVRSLRRTLGALSVVLLAAVASLAAVVPAAQAASGKTQRPPLAISITGITPTPYATPDATVTVTGTLANHTGAALPGTEVLARTSLASFQFPAQLTDFTNAAGTGTSVLPLQQAGEAYQVPDSVPNGATVRWVVSFHAGEFYSQFGVFPIEVQAQAGGTTYTASARTLPRECNTGDAGRRRAKQQNTQKGSERTGGNKKERAHEQRRQRQRTRRARARTHTQAHASTHKSKRTRAAQPRIAATKSTCTQ